MNIDQVVLNTKTIIRSSILSLLQILNHQSQKNASEVQNQKINNLVENIITEVKQIANTHEEQKMPDLNAKDIEGAMKIIEGSARSAGITVEN